MEHIRELLRYAVYFTGYYVRDMVYSRSYNISMCTRCAIELTLYSRIQSKRLKDIPQYIPQNIPDYKVCYIIYPG